MGLSLRDLVPMWQHHPHHRQRLVKVCSCVGVGCGVWVAVLAGVVRGVVPGLALARERGIQDTKSDHREGGRAGMLSIWNKKYQLVTAIMFHFMFSSSCFF